jgi:hypothetical protein
LPKSPLRLPVVVGDRRQGQENCPVAQIWPANYILDAIEKNGARRLKQHLVLIRIELAQPKACARGEPAKRV